MASLALPRASSAAEHWLRVESSQHCSVSAAWLTAAVRSRVVGEPNSALQVKVAFSEAPRRAAGEAAPIRASIVLELGAESISVKRLEAGACAEALEAVVVVLALALSTEPLQRTAPASTPERAAPAASGGALLKELELGSLEPAPRSESAASVDALRSPTAARSRDSKLSLSVLADRGTLSEPTVLIGTVAALPFGSGELRSALWYALPSVREEVSLGLERTHTDYIGGALGYCRGLDSGQWLSACTGLELGLVRRSRELEAPGQSRTELEQISPRLAAALGLTFAYREAPLEPAFDLAAQTPVLGRLAAAPRLGFRAGLSAGLRF
jgi:hypothetical protein